ncbi:AAA family ATPase [Corallococcus exiguus]|uniref:AAA family ATPase n=1 Tax=Corallococcus exiguus TaxID=83462 RepID=UPI001494C9D0|nr:AAA family ATPase [Corallococcus exiguus]NPD29041.1 AAA family ATPase [Corallococcus exiguus]
MLTSLRIQNFRSLRKLSVEGLTRVSLLVGANNTGKTSVLEAAELVLAGSSPSVILRSPVRRGELSAHIEDGQVTELAEVTHLFSRHSIENQSSFRIETAEPDGNYFEGVIGHEPGLLKPSGAILPRGSGPKLINDARFIQLRSDRFNPVAYTLLDRALPLYIVSAGTDALRPGAGVRRVGFIETTSPNSASIRELWDEVVLTPEEERVTDVLRIIEPGIERVAALAGSHGRSDMSIFVRLRDSDQRIPLGSMGEGIKRLMTLSLNLVNVAGGYLLVDEIDTGLHHSVMVKMWRLVTEAAKRLNVQVLATTHSLDCVRALAALYEEQQDLRDIISVHRIERNAENNVPYSADELLAAARHEMEIR